MILGAILAGGQSSRFGSDKAAALLDGRTLIDHVAEAVAREVDAVIVCGGQYPGLKNVPDRPRPALGPLGGINAALRYAADNGFAAVLTAPCDTPRLDRDLLGVLMQGPAPLYLSSLPVLGLWPSRLADGLDTYLEGADDLSVRRWCRAIGAAALDREGPANINARDDLDRLDAQP
ncbi:molybdenum cofactor guanylyltransferase [Sphingomonas koreensis]